MFSVCSAILTTIVWMFFSLFLSVMSRRSFRLMSGGYYNSDEESDSSTVTNISYRENPVKYVTFKCASMCVAWCFVSSSDFQTVMWARSNFCLLCVYLHSLSSGFSRRRWGHARARTGLLLVITVVILPTMSFLMLKAHMIEYEINTY